MSVVVLLRRRLGSLGPAVVAREDRFVVVVVVVVRREERARRRHRDGHRGLELVAQRPAELPPPRERRHEGGRQQEHKGPHLCPAFALATASPNNAGGAAGALFWEPAVLVYGAVSYEI